VACVSAGRFQIYKQQDQDTSPNREQHTLTARPVSYQPGQQRGCRQYQRYLSDAWWSPGRDQPTWNQVTGQCHPNDDARQQ
jgi:hypothetical protein